MQLYKFIPTISLHSNDKLQKANNAFIPQKE